MKKQFLFNIFLLILLNALIKPFWVFGIDRTVQNTVGSEAYGLYFALFNFSVLFNTFLDFGITNFNNRSISQSPNLINHYFPRLTFIKLFLGICYLIICITMSLVLGYSNEAVRILGLLALNQFIASLLLFFRSNISGLQLYTADSIISVIDRFLMIVFCGVLLWTEILPFKINIQVFALLQTFAYAVTCLIAIAVLLKKKGTISFKKTPFFSLDMLRKSFPFAVLGFIMVIYSRIDAVLIERMLPNGALAAGKYAQSFRIYDAVTMISVLFASLLLPMFANLLTNKKDIKGIVKLAFSLLFTGTAILAITFSIFATPVLNVLYKESFPESVNVFVLLSICIVPVSVTYIFGTLLTADGKLRVLIIVAIITLFINIVLNITLIPILGISGAALSALVSQLIASTAQVLLCFKIYKFKFNWKHLLPYMVFVTFSILIAVLFNSFQMNLGLKLLSSLSISLFAAFFLKIISLRELFEVFLPEND